jgi:eukaryotic-like serine/threonine-protein kinase
MSARKSCTVCGSEFEADQKFCPNDGTPLRSSESTDPLVGQIIADRYRVVSKIGEGGMGRVYLAEQVRMGRQCAIKMISPELARTDAAIARFNREAANASQINHPNVVQVYDFGEGPDHTLYLAMEYVEGETLSALVRREGALSVRRAATLVKQATDALSAAHHRNIVHRDLKPDNIIVSRQYDGAECIKVVDFGIAKTMQPEGSEAGTGQTLTVGGSVGTPEYMSPEQLAGERLDGRSDLYSLGLVFFHLLTANLAHPRVTSRETLVHRLTEPPRTLAEARPDKQWPAMLQPMLDWALAMDPAKRYPTAQEFATDLSILIAAEPMDAVAPPTTNEARSGEFVSPNAPTVADAQRFPEHEGREPSK